MDYRDTLNLPRTDFPMRAQLPEREPGILKHWNEMDIYASVRRHRGGAPLFILHDGPPYANGNIHIGHALNKVLKDIVIKYKTMRGFDAPFIPGWDTHGLPIEHQIIKTRGVNRKEISDLEFRRLCRDYALEYVNIQREQFKRLGVRGDWENPYLTLNPSFEARQIGVFGKLAARGFIYKGLRPVYWCPRCETALAEAEIEYSTHLSDSIYVKFPVTDDRGLFGLDAPVSCLIWTTTAWTIPANLAIALHPELEYALVDNGSERYLLAAELVETVSRILGGNRWAVVKRFKGKELEGLRCRHPLFNRESVLVLGDHVTLEQGTGCVHTAPGHGHEDFAVGRAYNLDVLSPLDNGGVFTAEAGEFAGLHYEEGNRAVIAALQREGMLLKAEAVEHQYPHCWRCKKPVLFRATEQWFASVDGFREAALRSIGKIKWIPPWGEERIHNMVAERQDWCISRQRVWGVPIPIFYCGGCEKPVISDVTIEAVRSLFEREGSDAWFSRSPEEILPAGFTCPECGGAGFRKESDTMDVWFDSGSSHFAVLEGRPGLQWPADLYLEGSDQYRGWFHSSLLTAVADRGEPPYRGVLSHGWVVDGEGRKMSKSLGNVIAPDKVIKKYGADILRLWVSSADFTSDVNISSDILLQLSEVYRKIRNTCRFLLGNCFDFDLSNHAVPYSSMTELDRWALYRLAGLIEKVTRAYEEYEFHQVFHALHNFCVVDMSSFYLDVLKDRLYCSAAGDPRRRSTQTVLTLILEALTSLIAPILTFTAEELWQQLPGERQPSVQMADWPKPDGEWLDRDLGRRWDILLQVREEVSRALEQARRDKMIGGSLEAAVYLWAGDAVYGQLAALEDQLDTLFIVSATAIYRGNEAPPEAEDAGRLPLKILIRKAAGNKCGRCWIYSAGADSLCPRCAKVLDR